MCGKAMSQGKARDATHATPGQREALASIQSRSDQNSAVCVRDRYPNGRRLAEASCRRHRARSRRETPYSLGSETFVVGGFVNKGFHLLHTVHLEVYRASMQFTVNCDSGRHVWTAMYSRGAQGRNTGLLRS